MKRSKLKKSDFPEDLRYSRERFWVREFPDGVVRVGLALQAVQDDVPGVYFYHSRNTGYIVTGKKFGFVDLDSGRFDLIAPLSGRIARVNPRLAEDPALIAADCYGDGWICDLTRVLPEALNALLDRDSFYGWLRFEREARRLGLEPTIGSTQRVVEGEPWPQDIVVKFGGKVILRSRPVREGRNGTFTPQWTVGLKWRVKTQFEQPSIMMVQDPANDLVVRKWEYEVVDDWTEVSGEPCWVVKVTEFDCPPPIKHHRLSIAKSDFSLRMIEEVNNQDDKLRTRLPNDWGAEGYIEMRRPRELIVDLPLFPPENVDEKRLVAVGEEPKYVVEAAFEPKRMHVAMEADMPRENAKLRSEQTWELGLPWWKSAKRTMGDRTLITGELLA
jgi:glycine cleavage system H protein